MGIVKKRGLNDFKQTSQRWSNEILLSGSSVEGEEIPNTASHAMERQPQVVLHPDSIEVIQRNGYLPSTWILFDSLCLPISWPGITATSELCQKFSTQKSSNFPWPSCEHTVFFYTHPWEWQCWQLCMMTLMFQPSLSDSHKVKSAIQRVESL